jgi:hypothetical protein
MERDAAIIIVSGPARAPGNSPSSGKPGLSHKVRTIHYVILFLGTTRLAFSRTGPGLPDEITLLIATLGVGRWSCSWPRLSVNASRSVTRNRARRSTCTCGNRPAATRRSIVRTETPSRSAASFLVTSSRSGT